MKFSHLCHFSFIFLIILICARLTFGVWTNETGLPVPDPGTILTCVDWILFYGFKIDDFKFNVDQAKNRNVRFDKNASSWAAMYAYELSGSYHTYAADFLPEIFCDEHGTYDIKYPFLPLKDERRTCEDWISLYGYTYENENFNMHKALLRDELLDPYISLWADGYGKALSSRYTHNYNMLPSNYCFEIGISQESLMSFMHRKGTQYTCETWIKIYGYNDDLAYNYDKALTHYPKPSEPFIIQLPWYVRKYSKDTYKRGKGYTITPLAFCIFRGFPENERFFFEPKIYYDN